MSARKDQGLERLFDVGPPDPIPPNPEPYVLKPSDIYHRVRQLNETDQNPYSALKFAAMSMIRRHEPPATEQQVKDYIVAQVLPLLDDSPLVDVYAACLTYDIELHKNAAEKLEKAYLGLQETAGGDKECGVKELYSAYTLFAQASPDTELSELLAKVALLRAEIVCGGVGNSFESLFNLGLELYSDDGGIRRMRYYEALFSTFMGVVEDYRYAWYTGGFDLTATDFAKLIRMQGRQRRVTSGVLSVVMNFPPQLDFSAPVDATM